MSEMACYRQLTLTSGLPSRGSLAARGYVS